MSIYSNQPDVQLALPDNAPDPSRPLIEPLELPPTLGRAYTAFRDASGRSVGDGENAVWARVTPRGHWRVNNLAEPEQHCRGCGESWLACQLETARCSKPASAQDIASALLAFLRPEPAPMRSPQVRFIRTAVAA